MEIVILDGFKVVGVKITCEEELLGVEMLKLWTDFMERLIEIKNRTDDYVMDISLEVSGKNYTQCICAKVDSFEYIPEGMEGLIIQQNKYIHYRHEGSVSEIWMSFWNMQKWVKENGCNIDPTDFKIDANRENDNLVHELYIRII